MESLVQSLPQNSPKPHNHEHHHDDDHDGPTLTTTTTNTTNHHLQQTRTNSSTLFINKTTSTQLSNKGSMIKHNKRSMPLLVINYLCLFIGSVSSSLLSKYYFIHKGSSIWVSTWVQCSGCPLLLPFIFVPYYLLHCTQRKPFSHFTPKILVLSVLIGLMLGLNNLLFSWGNSYLPVSTSSLLLSSQLVFNLILSVIIVKQKVTFSNLNCVILLTVSSVLLALGSHHDKPHGLTRSKYFLGFFSTIGAGLLFALYLPVMEKIYSKVNCYAMVIEMQLVMEAAATVFAMAGMALNGGIREMKAESERVYDKGENVYWVTLWCNVVTWQLCFMGTAGMVFLTSSLTGGICMTALMGMNVLGGVLVYGDSFGGVKAVSTFLCGWGFCSYVYGLYMNARDIEEEDGGEGDGDNEGTHQETEMDVRKLNDSSV